MKRVVITGMGIVSSLGCKLSEVTESLRQGRSGLRNVAELRAAGLPSGVFAPVQGFDENCIDPRSRRTMSSAALYAVVAAQSALQDAGLARDQLEPSRTAVIVGGEMGGVNELAAMHRLLHAGKKSRSGTAGTTKAMDSTTSGNIASFMGLQGRAFAISAGTCSGLAAIRHGAQLVAQGVADLALCGGADEDGWRYLGPALSRCGELPTGYDDQPERACRPFDAARRGVVLSAGSAMFVLESEDHARQRGARLLAEVVGWGSASDGAGSLRPNGRGLRRAIEQALVQAREQGLAKLDYIHSGANGTRVGDAVEATVLREFFGNEVRVSSTTGLSGSAVGAGSAIGAALTVLMLRERFIAPTTNLELVAPECAGLRHVYEQQPIEIQSALCTAASFGCFNESLVLRWVEG